MVAGEANERGNELRTNSTELLTRELGRRELETIIVVATLLNSGELRMERILEVSMQAITDALQAEAGSIFLLDERSDELEAHGRPILLTEYLARTSGSTFEGALPLLKERNVGAYNWGFVAGKTQTIYPWDSWTKTYTDEPDPWFHDILHPDGTPYDGEETRLIRALTRRG